MSLSQANSPYLRYCLTRPGAYGLRHLLLPHAGDKTWIVVIRNSDFTWCNRYVTKTTGMYSVNASFSHLEICVVGFPTFVLTLFLVTDCTDVGKTHVFGVSMFIEHYSIHMAAVQSVRKIGKCKFTGNPDI